MARTLSGKGPREVWELLCEGQGLAAGTWESGSWRAEEGEEVACQT